ncbi:taurine ABC transporter ATP-binding protein [Xanthobacter sediminis]
MTELLLNDVSITFPETGPVVDRLTLSVASGDFVVVLGPSGCGKSTMLRLAAGFSRPDTGVVLVDGAPVKGPGADRAMVFQDDALFPWASVRDNVALGLRLRGVPRRERNAAADAIIEKVGLKGAERRPVTALSGGQRQRVGLARALLAEPKFLLLDEPLGALDALTRETMQTLLIALWARAKAGFLMITHSVDEALLLATRAIVLSPRPTRIVDQLDLDFSRRIAAGESARDVRRDPGFEIARERLLTAVTTRVPA